MSDREWMVRYYVAHIAAGIGWFLIFGAVLMGCAIGASVEAQPPVDDAYIAGVLLALPVGFVLLFVAWLADPT